MVSDYLISLKLLEVFKENDPALFIERYITSRYPRSNSEGKHTFHLETIIKELLYSTIIKITVKGLFSKFLDKIDLFKFQVRIVQVSSNCYNIVQSYKHQTSIQIQHLRKQRSRGIVEICENGIKWRKRLNLKISRYRASKKLSYKYYSCFSGSILKLTYMFKSTSI